MPKYFALPVGEQRAGLWHRKSIGDFSARELADCFSDNPGSSHQQTSMPKGGAMGIRRPPLTDRGH
jgi:hypothetical protein